MPKARAHYIGASLSGVEQRHDLVGEGTPLLGSRQALPTISLLIARCPLGMNDNVESLEIIATSNVTAGKTAEHTKRLRDLNPTLHMAVARAIHCRRR